MVIVGPLLRWVSILLCKISQVSGFKGHYIVINSGAVPHFLRLMRQQESTSVAETTTMRTITGWGLGYILIHALFLQVVVLF